MIPLTALTRVSLNKAAVDSGFDVAEGEDFGWLRYRSTSSPVRAALTVVNDLPVGALSSEGVLAELRLPDFRDIDIPNGYAGCFAAASFGEAQDILTRAYALGRALPDELYKSWQDAVGHIGPTERDATVKQRIGQDYFRRGLLSLWNERCAITGLAVPDLLRASHAKPWKHASDTERLDVFNGLLLVAHLDAAFDAGLICIAHDGAVEISDELDSSTRTILGLGDGLRVERLSVRHQKYLDWHRRHVFAGRIS
ncbi:hypothetical protein BWI17_19220 [Betaproteobacteria bacterium GR16-43]|nr:hypothetical protein BWI17_19220 [Betaproteobacteria bacterium GR16-43]